MVEVWKCGNCSTRAYKTEDIEEKIPSLKSNECPECGGQITVEGMERIGQNGLNVELRYHTKIMIARKELEDINNEPLLKGFLDRILHGTGLIDGLTEHEKQEKVRAKRKTIDSAKSRYLQYKRDRKR